MHFDDTIEEILIFALFFIVNLYSERSYCRKQSSLRLLQNNYKSLILALFKSKSELKIEDQLKLSQ